MSIAARVKLAWLKFIISKTLFAFLFRRCDYAQLITTLVFSWSYNPALLHKLDASAGSSSSTKDTAPSNSRFDGYIRMHMCMRVCMRVYMCVYACAYVRVCACARVRVCACVRVCVCACVRV